MLTTHLNLVQRLGKTGGILHKRTLNVLIIVNNERDLSYFGSPVRYYETQEISVTRTQCATTRPTADHTSGNHTVYFIYSEPSLIRMSDNPDREMKNIIHS
jgi:hypothetical protein